jgi:hypothetical protein
MLSIDEIIKIWTQDCQIDNLNLDSSTIKFASIHAKYLQLLTEAKLSVKRQKSQLEKLKQDKWLYYSGKMTQDEMDARGWAYDPFKGHSKPMKSDLDRYIDVDDEVVKSKLKLDYAEEISQALTEIIDTLRWRHQHIKNIIEWKKFAAGV